MNSIPSFRVCGQVQNQVANPNFSGGEVVVALPTPKQEEKSSNAVAIGLALAAAAGIGFLVRGKAKQATQALTDAVNDVKPQSISETANDIIKKAKKDKPWKNMPKSQKKHVKRQIRKMKDRELRVRKEAERQSAQAVVQSKRKVARLHVINQKANTAKTPEQFDSILKNGKAAVDDAQKNVEDAQKAFDQLRTHRAEQNLTRAHNKEVEARQEYMKLKKKINGNPSVDVEANIEKIDNTPIHGKSKRKQENIKKKRREKVYVQAEGLQAHKARKAAEKEANVAATKASPNYAAGVAKQAENAKKAAPKALNNALKKLTQHNKMSEVTALEYIVANPDKYSKEVCEFAGTKLAQWQKIMPNLR